jgi:hypothetical protein
VAPIVSLQNKRSARIAGTKRTHVATSEVTTLEHKVRDDTVEGGALVALLLRPLAQLPEVCSSLGNNVVKEVENDAAGLRRYTMAKQPLATSN